MVVASFLCFVMIFMAFQFRRIFYVSSASLFVTDLETEECVASRNLIGLLGNYCDSLGL